MTFSTLPFQGWRRTRVEPNFSVSPNPSSGAARFSLARLWTTSAPFDESTAERAGMLRSVALSTALIVTVILPFVIAVQPDALQRGLVAILVVDGLALATLVLNRKGHRTPASWLYLVVLLALVTLMSLAAGGIRSPGVQAFFVFVMLAGLLLGDRVGVVVALVCASLGLALVVSESIGILPEQSVVYNAWAHWLLNCVYIGVALLTMRLGTRSIQRALERARGELNQRRAAEGEREQLVANLRERVKELRLLHGVSQLLRQGRTVDRDLLDEIVALIPPAWVHTQDCRARIVYRDVEVASPGWQSSRWKQSAMFETSAGRGTVEVVYLNEQPDADEGPFLYEERALIDSVAQMLRSCIEEQVAEQQRRGLEGQLRQAQKMDALGTLAGGIAHDFNNILTAIGGNTELARSEAPAGSAIWDNLDEILKAYLRARDLVRRILLFSRRQESVKSVVELPSVVDEALKLLRSSVSARVRLETAVDPGLPAVLADSSQIHQIVMNLGTNAVYAMGERGGTLSVSLENVAIGNVADSPSADLTPGRYVRLSVRDTGAGMTAAVRDRLFEPFFTTKGHAGTGLGLSVVHGIVRDHHGTITVDSELGVGSVFHVFFPAADRGEQRTAIRQLDVIRGAGQHVMYVDDEEALTLLMSRMLERIGYRCTAFTTVDAAMQEFRINPHRFDAVMTDMQMPTLNGVELAQAFRQIRPDVPVVIASGYVPPEESDHEVVWLTKPMPMVDLSRALSNLLCARPPAA